MFSLDWSAEWMIKWLRKMAREDIASIAPRQEVVDELVRYGDQIHKTLTWTGGCRSWYKANRVDGRVTATFCRECNFVPSASQGDPGGGL
jgi:hypothetical protein